MKNNRKSKFLIPFFISLGILLTAISGLVFALTNQNSNVIYARESIDLPIAVKRINNSTIYTADDKIIQSSISSEKLGNVLDSEDVKTPNSKPIKNDELILLDSTEAIFVSFNVDKISYDNGIKVETINSSVTYRTLSVNAYLNGKAIMTTENNEGGNNHFFYQYLLFDDSEAKYLDGTTIEQADKQGHYKFVFAYSEKDADNNVLPLVTKEIDFYVYLNANYAYEEKIIEPKLYNTEVVKRNLTNTEVQENFFNFNNANTYDYFGNQTQTDKLYYPTISFDATKYNVSFRRNLYENYNVYDFRTVLENGSASLKVYKNNNLLSNEEIAQETCFSVSKDENLDNVYHIVLNDIGEYEITYNYIIEQKQYNSSTNQFDLVGYIINPADAEAEDTSKDNSSFVKNANWEQIGNNKLYIFGYQLMYSDYSNSTQSGNKEFKLGEKTSDMTFKNNEGASVFEANQNLSTLNLEINQENIVSTNQAPVSLSYYARMTTNNTRLTNSYALRWNSVDDYNNVAPEIIEHITNNTKFIDNGYYQLFIEYSFESYKKANDNELENDPQNIRHYQFFSFIIKNSEPIISVQTSSQDELNGEDFENAQVLSSNGYTKNNIHISWEANTEFDIEPRIQIQRRNYGSTNWTTVYGQNTSGEYVNSAIQYIVKKSDNYLVIKANGANDGEYQVILNYGPGKNTLVKYKFNIDTESLEDKIKLYSVLKGTSVSDEISSEIINSAFALNWTAKNSGAKITASYDFIPLEYDNEFNAYTNANDLINIDAHIDQNTKVTDLVSMFANTEINIWNGYVLKNINRNIPYENTVISGNSIQNSSTIRTSAGYYIFTIKDEAGNVATKTIFVDNSTPVIYSYTEKESNYVAITSAIDKLSSRDTIVVWGNNKLIKIDNSVADLFGGENQLLIPINNIQTKIGTEQDSTRTLSNIYQVFHIKGNAWNDGDKTHIITIKDLSNTSDKNNSRVYDNSLKYELRMNSDNSLLMAYMSEDGLAGFEEIRSDTNHFGTGNQLYLEWIQNEGNEFEVKSVKYYYFPLTFEQGSPNYPYASNYSKVEEIDFETLRQSLVVGDKVMTDAINVQFGKTLEGMYIVKREYQNPLSADENETGDYSPRYYIFIVDRNKVISYSNSNNLIGGEIGLFIGSNQKAGYQVEFVGEDFLYDTSSNLKFTTSKLPISWIKAIKTINKFGVSKLSNAQNLTLEDIDTGININSRVYGTFMLDSEHALTILYSATIPSGTANSNYSDEVYDFTKNGYYKVILSDRAENDVTSYEFFFRINVEEPRANIIRYVENESGQKEYLSYSEGETGISSNSTNMLLVWNKPADSDYDAEIDRANFTVLITFENGQTVDFVTQNNILSSSTAYIGNSRINVYRTQDTTAFENATWDYYIDYAEIFSLINTYYPQYKNQSARVDITLNYVGNESDYSVLGSSRFYETTKTVVFDFEKPSYNFDRLFGSDLYLNSLDITDEEFETENALINFENYAFTVDSSFTLNKMIPNPNSIWSDSSTDTYKIFYREYDKYADETISNQQSIVPTDARFDNLIGYPNRYRFDENLTIDGEKIYADISAYYWNEETSHYYTLADMGLVANKFYEIIEVDFAGNYRVYTIFVKDNSSTKTEADFTLENPNSDTVVNMDSNFELVNRYETELETNKTLLHTKEELANMISSLQYEKMFGQIYNLLSIENQNEALNKKFLTVKVEDITQKQVSMLTLSPNGDKAKFIEDFNSLVAPFNIQTGNIYYITFISSQNEVLKIEHRKPNRDYPAYTTVDGSIGFTISFNVKMNDENSSTYIKYFEAYRADKGVPTSEPLLTDSNGLAIVGDIESYILEKGDDQNFSYTFKIQGSSGSEYLITLIDNFNREIKIRKIIGVSDNQDKIVYSAATDKLVTVDATDNRQPVQVVYTNDNVSLKFQNVLYSVEIFKMKMSDSGNYLTEVEQIEIQEEEYTKLINGIWTYNLVNRDTESGVIYKIVFKSTQGDQIYYVGYETGLCNIVIKKASDGVEIAASNNQNYTFDKMVFVNVKDYTTLLFPVKIEVIKNGVRLGEVDNGYPIDELGDYQITIYNQLGTQINFNIKMIEKITESFWVTYKIGGVDAGILEYTNKTLADIGSELNPYEYFTIYEYDLKTNTSGNYAYEVKDTYEQTGAVSKLYRIYRTYMEDGESVEKDEKFVKISVIQTNSNFLRTNDNSFTINGQIMDKQNEKTISQDQENRTKTAILGFARPYNIVENNNISVSIYYNNVFVKTLDLSTLDENTTELTFTDSGIYDFYFQDVAGNKQKFGNSQFFRMILLNDVLFNVNSKQAVNNQVFNGEVKISLLQVSKFDNSLITLTVKKNGQVINPPSKINNTFTFKQDEYGLYNITLTGKVNGFEVSTDYTFRIINPEGTMSTFEYSGLNNYEIIKVVKYATKDSDTSVDITKAIKEKLDISTINVLALSSLENGLGGAGYYEITVQANYTTNKPSQTFSFNVWLNNDSDIKNLIECSIPFGSSTTKSISLTVNYEMIYNKIGECKILCNNQEIATINASNAASIKKGEITPITTNGTFNIRIVSNSGNTLGSFVVTKTEPLNSVAIVVIVISVVVVAAVVFIFIKLRKSMRVK